MLEVVFQNQFDVFFYAKDISSRWVSCNPASLLLLNLAVVDQVFGRSEVDFFPPAIAAAIRQDDLNVIQSGMPLLNRVELITNAEGALVWAKSNKFCIVSPMGVALGLIGTTALLPEGEALPRPLQPFKNTVDYIRTHLDQPIRIRDLAAQLGLSESQFRRKFAAQFGKSPQDFIMGLRMQSAARLLSENALPIVEICDACGFSDQSYFTRQFRRYFAETPRAYRARRASLA